MRFSDLLTLEWGHVHWDKKIIRKNLYKEKIPHTIPLTEEAIEILIRWKDKNINPRFVFNLLPENFNFDNELTLDNMRKNKNRALQASLHELGLKLATPLDFNLSIHVARHTYAIMALNSGHTLYELTRLLGHKSIASTEKYYARFIHTNLAEDVRIKMETLFKSIKYPLEGHNDLNY